MAVTRRIASERLSNVSDKPKRKFNTSKVKTSSRSSLSSSEDEAESDFYKSEVRDDFSVRKLMRKSEKCKVDGDHIYTAVAKVSGQDNMAFPNSNSFETGRKRKLSETSNDRCSKQKCLTKNALSAKLNRERKKRYVSSLEVENNTLKDENHELRESNERQNKRIKCLTQEISYLKSVLANSKELCRIMESIKSTGLPVTSSLLTSSQEDSHKVRQRKDDSTREDEQGTYHPRTMSFDFPILDKDVNLASLANCCNLPETESPFSDLDNYTSTSNDFNVENSSGCLFTGDNFDMTEPDIPPYDGGICLHLNNKMISVEFCYLCSKNSALSIFSPVT